MFSGLVKVSMGNTPGKFLIENFMMSVIVIIIFRYQQCLLFFRVDYTEILLRVSLFHLF